MTSARFAVRFENTLRDNSGSSPRLSRERMCKRNHTTKPAAATANTAALFLKTPRPRAPAS